MVISALDFMDKNEYKKIRDLFLVIDSFSSNWGLVGGIPRDYFIYKKILKIKELDILIEDIKNENLVKKILEFLINSYKEDIEKSIYHDKFLTGNIIFKGYNIDLITARTEKYSNIASLPIIYPTTLINDLLRRDITINSILFQKTDFKEGIYYFKVIDINNSIEDIKKKISILYIRIL